MFTKILNTLNVSALTFALILLFGISYAVAYTSPTSAPPGGSVDAPINTGPTTQTKMGGDICVQPDPADPTTKKCLSAAQASGPTLSFSVSPTIIQDGTSATLSWPAISGATSCTITKPDNSTVSANVAGGSISTGTINSGQALSATASKFYTYTLSCNGGGGTSNINTILTVLAPYSVTATNGAILSVSIPNGVTQVTFSANGGHGGMGAEYGGAGGAYNGGGGGAGAFYLSGGVYKPILIAGGGGGVYSGAGGIGGSTVSGNGAGGAGTQYSNGASYGNPGSVGNGGTGTSNDSGYGLGGATTNNGTTGQFSSGFAPVSGGSGGHSIGNGSTLTGVLVGGNSIPGVGGGGGGGYGGGGGAGGTYTSGDFGSYSIIIGAAGGGGGSYANTNLSPVSSAGRSLSLSAIMSPTVIYLVGASGGYGNYGDPPSSAMSGSITMTW